MQDKNKINLLLVDDHTDNLIAMRAILEELGENLVMVDSGKKALRRLLDEDFAIVLLDVDMPLMDGFEVAEMMRQIKKLQHTPIIFLTAIHQNESNVFKGYSLGAVDYIFKPFEPEVLKAKVRFFIELYRKTAELNYQADLLRQTNEKLDQLNLDLERRVTQRTSQLQAAVKMLEREVAERENTQERLRQREQELTDFVENAPVGLHWVGGDGTILWSNQAELDLLGYAREEYIGHNVAEFHAEKPLIEDLLQRLTNREVLQNYESRLRCKDGSIKHVLINSNVRWKDDEFVHTRCFTRDITERKQAEKEREELLSRERLARAEAEAANRLKDEFLATLSHELRTPLNSILGWVQLLSSHTLDEKTSLRALETIERNAKLQAQLIEDILDVSSIVTGKFQLHKQWVALDEIIHQAAETLRPTIEAKNIKLQLEFEPAIKPLSGDPTRLEQVVWNLLSNAIKFTPSSGQITVSLEQIGSMIRLQVRDTGQGIKAAFLPYVFDRFRQADGSTTRAQGGLGLGLAIVRRVVELHEGKVLAESLGEGQGACFTVDLPLEISHSSNNGSKEFAASRGNHQGVEEVPTLAGVRVLVVDDQEDTRDLICFILKQCQAQIEAAGSVQEALAIIQEWPPHVLVSDLGMPDDDGYSLIKQMRTLHQGSLIQALALTGYAFDEERARALASGFQAYLTKPVEPGDLISVVTNLAYSRTKAIP